MTTNDGAYDFPAEHRGFLADFQALLRKHPRAAERFALADLGMDEGNLRVLRERPPDQGCVSTEWGLICKPISPPV